MNDTTLTLPQVNAELKAEIHRLDVKVDERTEQILDTIRETAEMIDVRQERRLHAALEAQESRLHSALEAQRHVLQSQIYQETGPLLRDQARTRAALDEHIQDDSRHVKPRAPKTAR